MFSWFKRRCPLSTFEKTWVEYRLRWLADRFGLQRIERPGFLTPAELWPAGWQESEANAQYVLEQICERMELPRGCLQLEIVDDVELRDAVGHYDPSELQPVVRLRRSLLADSLPTTATLAHEAAHHVLLGGGHQTGDEHDLEWTTDLLPAIFGLGPYAANATLTESSYHAGSMSYWSMSRQGYLPSRMFGYAFAVMTMFSRERPTWLSQLRTDARAAYDAGTAYLEGGGDSLFGPDTYVKGRPRRTPAELLRDLDHGTPTFRLGALWDLESCDEITIAAVVRRIRDHDPDIVAEAIAQAAAVPELGAVGRDEIRRRLEDPRERIRLAAVDAAGRLGIDDAEVLDALKFQLRDAASDTAAAAVQSLRRLGPAAEMLTPHVVRFLREAVIHGKAAAIDAAAAALWAITLTPFDDLRAADVSDDDDVGREMIRAVNVNRPVVEES